MENTIGNEMKSENARMFINKQMQRKLSLFLKNVDSENNVPEIEIP